MRRYFILMAVVCFLGSLTTPWMGFAAETKKLVEVETGTLANALTLQKMGVDVVSHRMAPTVQVLATLEEIDQLKGRGWGVRIIVEDPVAAFHQEINMDGNLGNYHTYAEMLDEMRSIAREYPEITRLVDIGDSWEKTQGIADRDIWAMKISNNPDQDEPGEPNVLIMGCHHARELISVEIPLAIIKKLTDDYSVDPLCKRLVDNRQIWVVPMVNPDGHVYVETVNPLWRKNRNTNGSPNPDSQGVDLNRNYGFKWGFDDIGSSPKPSAEDYRGAAAFSEPETRTVRDLVEVHDFDLALSYHSYGDMVVFPWHYVSRDTRDNRTFKRLGRTYTISNGYAYGNVKDHILYRTNGDLDDWMYGARDGKHKALSVTVEVGHDFQPPSDAIPCLIDENLMPALQTIKSFSQSPAGQ
jgi:hypothetical protein